jgi:ATP-dependent Zn protease
MDKKSIFWMILIVLVMLAIGRLFPGAAGFMGVDQPAVPVEHVTFSDLNRLITEHPDQVSRLTFLNGKNEVIVERPGKQPVKVEIPDDGGKQVLIKSAADSKVPIDAKETKKDGPSGFDYFFALIIQLLPIIFIVAIILFFMRNAQQGVQRQLANSKAQQVQPAADRKTFADVAGCDEAKQELMEVVEYLRNPGLLAHLGGRPPRGVLLVGPPGNGKTLLAKATAGEAGAAFFAISASQFVEMFVGVGAARVRDLFDQARAKKPAIVFIDEIDAVGRQRGAGIGGGHDEREQTLNQLLVEMDGFSPNSGLILMAATNRPDILDPALVRPGRFDRQVLVDHADVNGREAIFRIHMRNKKTAANVDAKELARLTPGFSGAEIEGVCNEAATVAARRIKEEVAEKLALKGKFSYEGLRAVSDAILEEAIKPSVIRRLGASTIGSTVAADLRKRLVSEQGVASILAEVKANSQVIDEVAAAVADITISRPDFVEGIDRVQMGVARTSRAKSMSREDMENTSVHELGHALIMTLIEGGDPVTKITIMPRGGALGVTQSLPSGDRYGYTRAQLLARMLMAMGGRAAQEVILDTVDTGAQNDFKQAWSIAHRMVTEFGMSKLGPIFVSDDSSNPFLGRAMAAPGGHGSELGNAIDREVRCLVNGCLAKAKELITEHKAFMLKANEVLLEKETLLSDEWQALLKEHNIVPHQVKTDIDCSAIGDCNHCGRNKGAAKLVPETEVIQPEKPVSGSKDGSPEDKPAA